jgi:hypothetical protein
MSNVPVPCDSRHFLYVDSAVLRRQIEDLAGRVDAECTLLREPSPRFWRSIADKGRFWTENADMFSAQLPMVRDFERVPNR